MNTVMSSTVYEDLSREELVKHALQNKEGIIAANGALVVTTGARTGRSPKDRFIVKDQITAEAVDWGTINQPITADRFQALWDRSAAYLAQKPCYVSHCRVGADDKHHLSVKVITETAWHNLFAQNLFIKTPGDKANGADRWVILSTPGLSTDPQRDGVHDDGAVIINFQERKVLLVGMRYAGEMKKAMFSVLNFSLTEHDVLPMHCAANMGKTGDVALFFGLSGTGKTTLSADPERLLIGDDEHGWSATGVFNFEGGCYAKCINLSHEKEPVIWDAIKANAIMENVVLHSDGEPNYDDDKFTQNTRAAYPREHIPLRVAENKGGLPKAVIFLTCDLYGILPPVSLLTKEQAAYYFLSGYTAKVGSTEVGSSNAFAPSFSACFGAPFFPRPAHIYAELLIKRIEQSGSQVYLVNTGWTGGAYGEGGKRFDIPVTRAIIRDIMNDEIKKQSLDNFAGFNIKIPTHISGVDASLLDPQKTWKDAQAFTQMRQELMRQFKENFAKFTISAAVQAAGPE